MKQFSDVGLVSANAYDCEHTNSIVYSNGKFTWAKVPLRSAGFCPEQSLPNKSLNSNKH